MNFFRVVNNLFRFNRTNWKAVSLCFLAATVFWFFNALNKEYASNVRFKLQFDFDQSKFIQANPLPTEVFVNVSGNGWDLLRKYLGLKKPPLVITLERPIETKKIVGSTLPPLLASQLGNLKINHIVTDTLYISIEHKDSLKMRVLVDPAAITFKSGYGRVSPIVVLPDSVQVEGPKSIIKRLSHTLLLMLPEKKLDGNYREQMEVALTGAESIKRNPPVVEVMFEVGEVVELSKPIKIVVAHIPYAGRIMQYEDSVTCLIQIPKTRMEDFNQSLVGIKAEVDLTKEQNGGKRLLPTVQGLPPYAALIKSDTVRLKLY